MTAHIVTIAAIAVTLSTARVLDINKLPPMDDYSWQEAGKLNGRDVEAVDAALRQFREDHFSTSGDLKHFTVELRRHGDRLAVAFFPEYIDRHLITPARNKYGVYITYFVSLRTLKIVGYHYERD